MAKYHISPTTGRPNLCTATKRGCPLGATEAEHYESKDAARAAYEASMAAETFKKPSKEEQATPENPAEDSSLTYTFTRDRLQAAINTIDKANRRAERAGIPERMSYELVHFQERTKDANGLDEIEEWVQFTLHKPTLKHDGWTFAGTMTWDEESGLITRMAPGEELCFRLCFAEMHLLMFD